MISTMIDSHLRSVQRVVEYLASYVILNSSSNFRSPAGLRQRLAKWELTKRMHYDTKDDTGKETKKQNWKTVITTKERYER